MGYPVGEVVNSLASHCCSLEFDYRYQLSKLELVVFTPTQTH